MSSDPRNSPDLPPAKASHGTSSGKLCTIELHKDAMKFSAGHFTIFSAERRERLHGHNFAVAVELTGETDDCGLMGEYAHYKRIIQELCDNLDEYFLLPGHSPHLRLHTEGDQLVA
ncbi:MAG TPA: 6-carboxytetrahydropterin synthase, partial [Nannocystis sp.]